MPEPGSALFETLRIGGLSVPGRVYKSATSETRASREGFVTDELIAFYEPIAKGGTPLIISGNMYVSRDGQSTVRMCGIDSDEKIPGLKRLAEAVHAHGSKIFVQLNHAGRQVIPHAVGLREAVAPSRVKELAQGTVPRAMRIDEIHRLIQHFANAAARVKRAGFDGVQLHCAHGYLIGQFLTPHTNRRTDAYGGSFDNRLRFLKEIFHATRAKVGNDFPIILKMNGTDALPLRHGLKNDELVRIAEAMQQEGIDAVEISVSHYESGFLVFRGSYFRFFMGFIESGLVGELPLVRRWAIRLGWPIIALFGSLLWFRREGYNTRYARNFMQALTIPVLSVGGFQKREAMQRALDDGMCDAVSCARSFIADPLLYKHLQENTQGPRCVFCNECVGRVGASPVDCYHPKVRAQKDAMLGTE
jgi:2,4-dienoyl-CoA reductase-like NADH-dependent reductase (Old Yellow Enzyme family)